MANPLTPPTPGAVAPTGLLADRNRFQRQMDRRPIRTMNQQLQDPNLNPKMRGRYEREILRQGGNFAKGYDPRMNDGAVNRYQQQYKQQNTPPPPPPAQAPQQTQQMAWVGGTPPNFQMPQGVRPQFQLPQGKQGIPQNPTNVPSYYQSINRGR